MHVWTIVCLFVTLVIVAFLSQSYHSKIQKEYMLDFSSVQSCPSANASFDQKRFNNNTKCFAHEQVDCEDILRLKKIPIAVKGMSDKDVTAALDVLANNTYMNVNGTDNALYSANECVITEPDRKALGLQSCKIGNIELQKGNPLDDQVVWTYENGCVITEPQLRTNLGDILAHIDDKFNKNKDSIQTNVNVASQANKDATAASWQVYNSNVAESGVQKRSAESARSSTQASRERAAVLSSSEGTLSSQAAQSNASADLNEVRYGRMRKDCSVIRSESACNASCGWGTKTVTIRHDKAENGGNACAEREGTSSVSCFERACAPPPPPSNTSRIGISCPNGASRYFFNGSRNGFSSDQARAACEACFGSCEHVTGDCAGFGWRRRAGGNHTFGYQSGCSGGAGRIWPFGSSFTTFGRWDQA